MYELERLALGVPFEVLDQLGDSVGVGPGFAPVVAGPESVGTLQIPYFSLLRLLLLALRSGFLQKRGEA